MTQYLPNRIRDIAVLGHQGSGKTTLVESLYHITENTPIKGEVEKKNTVSDYLLEEQKKLSSISSSIVPIYYNDYKINLIDIPGNDDFIGEVLSVTRLIKGAVLVVDATTKVQVGTIKHWHILRKRNIPTIVFVNKMDKDNVNFEEVLTDIREKLGKNAVPFCYPVGHKDDFDGFVNVVDLKARIFDGEKCVDAEIYEDKKMKVLELHNIIVEQVAGFDDTLLEKFFNGETLTNEEIHSGLRTGVLTGQLIPVLVGSATKDIGIHTMLQMFVDYLPNPSDLKPYLVTDGKGDEIERKTEITEPFSAYVFKTIVDPYAGIINVFKVNSGVLKVGDEIAIGTTGRTQKIGNLFNLVGKNQVSVTEVSAGDIAATSKLTDVRTCMTLCDPKHPVRYKEVKYPTAVMFQAISLSKKEDENKISQALAKIQLEDPSVEVKRNQETKQLLVGGVGASHLSFIIEKLRNTYKIPVEVANPKIVYRESIKGTATATGRYIKQSGGSGFYGVVEMRFEPAEETCFEEVVFGGAIPKNYFPAVEKGFLEALNQGQLAGYPVIGVKGVLLDGKYHTVDSNEMAFKMAAILAFKEAYMKCKPIILEPIVKVVVNVDSKYIGGVLSDINSRRARVLSIEEVEHGIQEVTALVPEAEILDYATQLKSFTQGSGFFNREFYSYEEVPSYLKDKVIAENKLIKD